MADLTLLTGANDLVRVGQHDAPALAIDPQAVTVPRVVGHCVEALAAHLLDRTNVERIGKPNMTATGCARLLCGAQSLQWND